MLIIRRMMLFTIIMALLVPTQPSSAFERSMLAVETAQGMRVFTIEIARTPNERAQGLMHREEMPRDHAMLFIFEGEAMRSMWMENTIIPLDMLFVDSTGRIQHIQPMTTPFSRKVISSRFPAKYVLEINGGLSDALGIGVGDRLESPLIGQ